MAWGPSNLNAQANEAVQANVALTALQAQNAYAQVQGQIHGSWWDIAKVIGTDVENATDEAGLQKALDNYQAAISALFNMSDAEKNAWSVIGALCGTNWDTDFPMTETAEGTFQSEVLELKGLVAELHGAWCVRLGEEGVGWSTRRMKSIWGSCHIRRRRVVYSLELARKARELVEYVVVHELTHLRVADHGPGFQRLMDERLPGWRDLRRRLNRGR